MLGYTSNVFSPCYYKGNYFNDLLFASLDVGTNLECNLFLTLLHSERPKLYTILAFLSVIGLKGSMEVAPIRFHNILAISRETVSSNMYA